MLNFYKQYRIFICFCCAILGFVFAFSLGVRADDDLYLYNGTFGFIVDGYDANTFVKTFDIKKNIPHSVAAKISNPDNRHYVLSVLDNTGSVDAPRVHLFGEIANSYNLVIIKLVESGNIPVFQSDAECIEYFKTGNSDGAVYIPPEDEVNLPQDQFAPPVLRSGGINALQYEMYSLRNGTSHPHISLQFVNNNADAEFFEIQCKGSYSNGIYKPLTRLGTAFSQQQYETITSGGVQNVNWVDFYSDQIIDDFSFSLFEKTNTIINKPIIQTSNEFGNYYLSEVLGNEFSFSDTKNSFNQVDGWSYPLLTNNESWRFRYAKVVDGQKYVSDWLVCSVDSTGDLTTNTQSSVKTTDKRDKDTNNQYGGDKVGTNGDIIINNNVPSSGSSGSDDDGLNFSGLVKTLRSFIQGVIDLVTVAIEGLGKLFSTVVTTFTGIFGEGSSLVQVFNSFLSGMPNELLSLIVLSLTTVVGVSVFKILRG